METRDFIKFLKGDEKNLDPRIVKKFHKLKNSYFWQDGFLFYKGPRREHKGNDDENDVEGKVDDNQNNSLNLNKYIQQIFGTVNDREDNEKIVVPYKFRGRILRLYHDKVFGGHRNWHATLFKIKKHCHWPQISKSVRAYCEGCRSCKLAKLLNRDYGETPPLFSVIHIDFGLYLHQTLLLGQPSRLFGLDGFPVLGYL